MLTLNTNNMNTNNNNNTNKIWYYGSIVYFIFDTYTLMDLWILRASKMLIKKWKNKLIIIFITIPLKLKQTHCEYLRIG